MLGSLHLIWFSNHNRTYLGGLPNEGDGCADSVKTACGVDSLALALAEEELAAAEALDVADESDPASDEL